MRLRLHAGCLGLAAFSALAAPAYLPEVGPPPVRFAAPFELEKALAGLPPLNLPTNSAASGAAATNANAAANGTNDPTAEATALPGAATNASPAAVPGVPLPPENLIGSTPADADMVPSSVWLKYFQRRSNGTGVQIIAPMGFTPPVPATAPASKATYSTPP